MPTVEHDGVDLAYDVAGPEDGPAVLMMHGITWARATWHDVAAPLTADHRVVSLDHRGHGGSSRADGTYDSTHWVGDAIAVLEQVVGRPAFLVGHSLGGLVSAQVAADRPDLVRAAFLEDPPLYLADPAEFAASPFAVVFGMLHDALRDLAAGGATVDEYVAAIAAMPALNGAGTMTDALGPDHVGRYGQALHDFDTAALGAVLDGKGIGAFDPTRPLGVPVAVLRADAVLMPAFRPQDEAPFLATNPGAQVDVVPGASHLIHDEQPGLVLDRIRTFLATHA